MSKLFKLLRNETGVSYIEVLLAVIILGIASSSFLNAIASGNQVTGKYTDNLIRFNYITTASEVIAKEEFVPCNDKTPKNSKGVSNPYPAAALFFENTLLDQNKFPIKIEEVVALGSDNQWHECGSSYWSGIDQYGKQIRPSLFQRIKICAEDPNVPNSCSSAPGNENYYWRYVFKNLGKITSPYSVKTSSDTNVCSSSNSNSINIVSGYIKSVPLLACNSSFSPANSPNLYFYTLPGSGPQASTSSCSISPSNEFAISITGSTLSICPGKTYVPDENSTKKVTIEIGAIDVNNSIYYNPISLAINIYYPPTLVAPDQIITESQLKLFGCVSNLQGCPIKSLSYVGGIPDTPVYYYLGTRVPLTPFLNGGNNFAIDINKGDLSLSDTLTNSDSIPGKFSVTVGLSGGGLPYMVSQNPFNVTVNPLINLSSNLSMQCGISSCSSGSYSTLATSGLYELASLTIKSTDPSVTPKIVNSIFDNSTLKWTFSVSASFTCKTYKVGKDTFYTPIRSTFTISDSVAALTSIYSSNSISFAACA